jgi:hypothetical protein
MTRLHQFLQSWNRPFVRGVSDCGAFVSAWLEVATGRPFECPHIGKPLSDAEASTVLGIPGGLRALCDHYFPAHGCFVREGEPQDGDIVIADRVQGFHSTLLGIWSAGQLVSVAREGLRYVRLAELSNISVYGH